MKLYSPRACTILATLWLLISLIPFLIAGEWWGTVWFTFNRPLSDILKQPLWQYGRAAYVFAVTILNATAVFILVSLVTTCISRLSDREK
jgi:hypothetical protein